MKTRYKMKKPHRAVQFFLFLFGYVLTLLRWVGVFDSRIVIISPEISSHVTNFALSLLFYLLIGSLWLISGVKFRYISGMGGLIIAANVACETLMGFMNTADIVDALYGAAGVLLVFAYFAVVKRTGLIPSVPKALQAPGDDTQEPAGDAT